MYLFRSFCFSATLFIIKIVSATNVSCSSNFSMNLIRRSPGSVLLKSLKVAPSSRLCVSIPSHTQPSNDSNNLIINSLSDSFRKGLTWDDLTKRFHSLHLTCTLVNGVLLELKDPSDSRSALNFFFWSAKTMNFNHQIDSYCITVLILVNARKVADAKILLGSLLRKKLDTSSGLAVAESLLDAYKVVPSSAMVFDLLVQAYAKLRRVDDGFRVCCFLEGNGFPMSFRTLNALLHVVQSSGENGLLWKVYEYMIAKKEYPNGETVRIMIDGLCKEGKLVVFVDMLDRIHGKRCPPAVIVSTSLVYRVIEDGRIEESMILLKKLLNKNLVLDTVAYSLVVYAKVRLGDLEGAREVYEEMLKRGFIANSFVYTSFVAAYCREGRIQEANSLFQEMEDIGLPPYQETFNHLIEGCVRAGDMSRSIGYCEDMIKRSLVPSVFAFNQLTEGLCQNGDSKKANDLLTCLLDKGFVPNEETYSHLVDGYGREGNVQEILKLYYEMEYRSMSPGLPIYKSLIMRLCQSGRLEEAEEYLRIMEDRSLCPSKEVYDTLVAAYFGKGDKGRAHSLLHKMESKDLR